MAILYEHRIYETNKKTKKSNETSTQHGQIKHINKNQKHF